MLASKIRYITWVHLWGTNGAGAAENHHLCALSSKNFGLAALVFGSALTPEHAEGR